MMILLSSYINAVIKTDICSHLPFMKIFSTCNVDKYTSTITEIKRSKVKC